MLDMTERVKTGRKRKDKSGKFQAAATVWVGLALLGGCSFAPNYSVPPVQTPAAFKEAEGWRVAQPKDDVIRGKWWEVFNDPQLNALEEQVAVSNQTLVAALANFQAARALVKEARSQSFPTVSAAPSVTKSKASSNVGASGNRGGSIPAVTEYPLPLDASWEPDLWGAIRNTVKADTFNAQASAATLENLRLTAQADLAVDYYSLRGQDALKDVLDATVVADQKTLDMTKGLFQAGIDSDEDVSEAETALATVKAQDTNIGIQRAGFEHAIALLLGRPASTFSIPVLPPTTNAPDQSAGNSSGRSFPVARTASRCRLRRAQRCRGQRANRRRQGGLLSHPDFERPGRVSKHLRRESVIRPERLLVAWGRDGADGF